MAKHEKNESGKRGEDKAIEIILKKFSELEREFGLSCEVLKRSKKERGFDKFNGKRAVESLDGEFIEFNKLPLRSYETPVYFEQEPYLKDRQMFTSSFSKHDGRLYLPSYKYDNVPFWDCSYEIKNQNQKGSVIEKVRDAFPSFVVESANRYKEQKLGKAHHCWTKEVGLLLSGDFITDEDINEVRKTTALTVFDKSEDTRRRMPRVIIDDLDEHFEKLFQRYSIFLSNLDEKDFEEDEVHFVRKSGREKGDVYLMSNTFYHVNPSEDVSEDPDDIINENVNHV